MTNTTFYYSNSTTSTSTNTTINSLSYTVPTGYNLTRVDIGSVVTSISGSTFLNKTSLITLNFLTRTNTLSIGTTCFKGCTGLTSVTIPQQITSIPSSCFQGCTGLTSFTLTASTVTSIGGSCFQGCSNLNSITIPTNATFTTITASCFQDCTSLTSITIPSNVTNLNQSSFKNTGLTSITVPTSITTMGLSCFQSCTSLTSIIIPSSVVSIGSACLTDCGILSSITYNNPSGITFVGGGLTNVNNIIINFYSTPSAPNPPSPATGVYNTSLYSGTSTIFNYFAASCYNIDTLILTLKDNKEQYIKIQDLRKNDLIKTYKNGYKPIKLIGKNVFVNNSSIFHCCMYSYKNLFITGGHSILVDEEPKENEHWYNCNYKIMDKYFKLCCDGNRFNKIDSNVEFTVFHLVLDGEETQYGIYINEGLLSETTTESNFYKSGFIEL